MEKTGQPARFSFLFFLLIKLNYFSQVIPIIIKQNNVKSNVPIMDGKHNSAHGLLPYPWLHNKNFFLILLKKEKNS